jgi:hypothetical protein
MVSTSVSLCLMLSFVISPIFNAIRSPRRYLKLRALTAPSIQALPISLLVRRQPIRYRCQHSTIAAESTPFGKYTLAILDDHVMYLVLGDSSFAMQFTRNALLYIKVSTNLYTWDLAQAMSQLRSSITDWCIPEEYQVLEDALFEICYREIERLQEPELQTGKLENRAARSNWLFRYCHLANLVHHFENPNVMTLLLELLRYSCRELTRT